MSTTRAATIVPGTVEYTAVHGKSRPSDNDAVNYTVVAISDDHTKYVGLRTRVFDFIERVHVPLTGRGKPARFVKYRTFPSARNE